MRDKSDRYRVQTVSALAVPKRIGSYLVDAGLLTMDQINVALNDQQATGMRFGEIVVARGWLKEQTLEWIVEKVVEPERETFKQREQQTPGQQNQAQQFQSIRQAGANPSATAKAPLKAAETTAQVTASGRNPSTDKSYGRRELPISKPLPSVNSSDSEVTWVG
jgi:hypothetical protein